MNVLVDLARQGLAVEPVLASTWKKHVQSPLRSADGPYDK